MRVHGRVGGTMTSDTDPVMAEDPITGEEIELPADVEVGEIIDSPVTGTELEVISLDPVVLEEAPNLRRIGASRWRRPPRPRHASGRHANRDPLLADPERREAAARRASRPRGHEVEKIDVRKERFGLESTTANVEDLDIVVDRCLSTSRSLYATKFLDSYGVPVVNSPETGDICADKAKNSLALAEADIPTPATEVTFTKEAAMESIEEFGYPCVLKPVVGSWGRLMAKIDTRNAAEAILEHKETLGHYEHKVFYIQEFVDKPGRDIRALAVDGEPIALR